MKLLILGNAGSGKTTLARALIARGAASRGPRADEPAACEPVALLALDALAFVPGTPERRPLAESVADALAFVRAHPSWIVEGCYAGLMAPLLPHAEELILLDPGARACLAHCRARPWEPDKFPSPAEQQAHLAHLLEWVAAYADRDDEYGRAAHRALFDAFPGRKRVLTDPAAYGDAVRGV